jgi:hypothetical protein
MAFCPGLPSRQPRSPLKLGKLPKAIALASLSVLLLSTHSLAGLYFERRVRSPDYDQTSQEYIQAGKLKVISRAEGQEMMNIIDLNRGVIILAHPGRGLYTEATLDEYRAFLDRKVEEMRRAMGAPGMPQAPAFRPPRPVVEIRDEGSGGPVAGYQTRRYLILVNGFPRERVWVSEELFEEVKREYGNTERIRQALKTLEGPQAGLFPTYHDDEAYQRTVAYPLRTMELMHRELDEITKVEKRQFSEAEFAPPAGLRKVALEEFFRGIFPEP